MPLCPDCGQRIRLAHEGEQAVESKPVPSRNDAKPRTQDELALLRRIKPMEKDDGKKAKAKKTKDTPPTIREV